MEKTRENYDKLQDELYLTKLFVKSKYGKTLTREQLASLDKVLNQKVMIYMTKYDETDTNKTASSTFLPIFEETAQTFIMQNQLVFNG